MVPRLHAHALMDALALHVPAGASSPTTDLVAENAARGKPIPSTSCSTPGSSTTAATARSPSTTRRPRPRTSWSGHGRATPAPERATLDVLPTLWFRNTWSWELGDRDAASALDGDSAQRRRPRRARPRGSCRASAVRRSALFCDNETNTGAPVRRGRGDARTPRTASTTTSSHGAATVNPGQAAPRRRALPLTVAAGRDRDDPSCGCADAHRGSTSATISTRVMERRARGRRVLRAAHARRRERRRGAVLRQAFAGMLWCKQFYHYDVARWLDGDPAQSAAAGRAPRRAQPRLDAPRQPRRHLDARHVGVPVVRRVGPRLPLRGPGPRRPRVRQAQLILLCREWYMHPNGQLPAYEWAFGDVNPPVHAWAALRVYEIARRRRPRLPRAGLPQAAAQLHLVGQPQGRRGQQRLRGRLPRARQHRPLRPLARCPSRACSSSPTARLDGHVLPNLLEIALVLAEHDHTYEDVATKFFEHFA